MIEIKQNKSKRFKCKTRSSLIPFDIASKGNNRRRTKDIILINKNMKIHLRLQWKRIIEESRDENKKYNEIRITESYRMFCKSRKLTKVWYQARLNVLPLNTFLKRIRKHETGLCSHDNEVEDTEHFIKRCKLYDDTWKNIYYHRQRRIKFYENPLELYIPYKNALWNEEVKKQVNERRRLKRIVKKLEIPNF